MKKQIVQCWVGVALLGVTTGLAGGSALAATESEATSPVLQPCKGTLSGGVTLSFDCTVGAGYDAIKHVSGVSFQAVNAPANFKTIAFANVMKGELSATTYDPSNLQNYGDTIAMQPMQYFVNSKGRFSGMHNLVITSISNAATSDKGTLYTIHGSLDATLVQVYPQGGAPLTAHIEF